ACARHRSARSGAGRGPPHRGVQARRAAADQYWVTATVEADAPEQATRVAAEPRRARLAHRVVLAVLLVQFVAVGLWQARHDSLTVDEAVDVASGVTSLVRHDLRMNPEHGPL